MKIPNLDFIENEWIPALRSGEYTQTKRALHDTVGYCCLGVACDLLDVTWSNIPYTHSFFYNDHNGDSDYQETSVLGPQVRGVIRIASNGIGLPPSVTYTWKGLYSNLDYVPLSSMNDGGATFNEIADALQFAVNAWRKHERETA